MITYYTTDSQGIYVSQITVAPYQALPSGTLTAPPATEGTEVARWFGNSWEVLAAYPEIQVAPLAQRQAAAWERIKAERDRRKVLGVKVGAHWYHSDADSRIQQLSLFVMGAAVPAIQWKTLTASGAPVFVTMTQALAAGIFQATAASDAAVFGAAEAHRVGMEASSTPETYDFSGGWPVAFGDAP